MSVVHARQIQCHTNVVVIIRTLYNDLTLTRAEKSQHLLTNPRVVRAASAIDIALLKECQSCASGVGYRHCTPSE